MPYKKCKICGKEFYTTSIAIYCKGSHYTKCEVCGKEFLIKDPNQIRRTCSAKCRSILRKSTISSEVKICKLCGKEFHSESNRAYYCEGPHYTNCPICGKQFEITDVVQIGTACSDICSKIKRRETSMREYGVPVPSQSASVKKRLSDSAISHNSERIKFIQNKYGEQYTNVAQIPEVRNKIRESVSSDDCKDRTKKTFRDRYGIDSAMQSKEFRSKQSRNSKNRSNLEIRLEHALSEHNIEFVSEYVIKSGSLLHSFDFYLPKYKILVDCDGIYWHSYMSDPDGLKVRDDYDDVRLALIPKDHIFHLIIESDFERGLKQLIEIIGSIDSDIYDYETDLFKWCRSIEFPYPSYSENRMLSDYKKLCDYDITKFNANCKYGISIIRNFHHSIYHAHVKKFVSPYDAWYDDDLLKKCILNRLIYKNEVDPSKVLDGFNISKIAPKVSVFNPVLAKYLILKYASSCIKIVDPFSGFSGRLLGALSAGKEYHGYDINKNAVNESNQIISFIGSGLCSVDYMNIFDSDRIESDLLFTCPPYGSSEIYSDESVFKSCDDWIDYIKEHFPSKKYLFVVDKTEKYSDNIVEELSGKSHFRKSSEYVILISG